MSVRVRDHGPSVSSLLHRAAEQAGTSDWGDLSFREPLGLLLESCRRTAKLTPDGWTVLEKVVLRHLRNRLSLREYVSCRGENMGAPPRDTVVVTGLPRTGTTLLHNLLALDSRHRFLRLWEALHPVPVDGDAEHRVLVAQAESWLERLYRLAPGFRSIHAGTPDGPEECDALLQNEFASQHFDDMFDAEEYSRWLYGTTLRAAYASYALQLRVLARPEDATRTWVLKSPSHLAHLDSLFEACPGTVVVHCHRDPLEAVPSYASLVLAVRSPHTTTVSPPRIGDQALNRCAVAMNRAMAVRERVGEERFVDVSYRSLVADPAGVVHGLYAQLGRDVSGEHNAAMRRWLEAHPQHGHGAHRYNLEQFCLTPTRVSGALEVYLSRFAPVLT